MDEVIKPQRPIQSLKDEVPAFASSTGSPHEHAHVSSGSNDLPLTHINDWEPMVCPPFLCVSMLTQLQAAKNSKTVPSSQPQLFLHTNFKARVTEAVFWLDSYYLFITSEKQ